MQESWARVRLALVYWFGGKVRWLLPPCNKRTATGWFLFPWILKDEEGYSLEKEKEVTLFLVVSSGPISSRQGA